MKWSGPVLNKLAKVRDMRLQLAEVAVSREERALEAALAREAQAHLALDEGRDRSATATREADEALVARSAGGRSAITQWKSDRGRARQILDEAQTAVDDAACSSDRQRQRCAQTRARWRELRFDVERLQALIDRAGRRGDGR
jgi:hypothetical protein